MHELHKRMDKAVTKIDKCENQCKNSAVSFSVVQRTKETMKNLNDYKLNDNFNAIDFERNLDRNLKN